MTTGSQRIIAATDVSTWHEKGPFIWAVASALLIWIFTGIIRFNDLQHGVAAAEQKAEQAQQEVVVNKEAIRDTLDIVQQNQWHTKAQTRQLERIERTVQNIQETGVDLTRKVQVLEYRSNPSYTGQR